jgi:hypothetical protein
LETAVRLQPSDDAALRHLETARQRHAEEEEAAATSPMLSPMASQRALAEVTFVPVLLG